jgi:perosamine synthetase
MRKEIPWWTPEIGPLEYDLIRSVLASNYVNEGEVTEEFEGRLADLLDVKHVTAVTSGTAAIMLALAGLGIGAGDEVIVPDVTFIATANAVVLAGASPVLVDVDPRTLNLDVEAAARAITVRTKAIVPVHVSGRSACIGEILAVARQHGLFVVEDAAEALTSRHGGRCLGTLGDAGCLSFSPNKTITTGQGGAVLTNDDRLHVRVRELKDQGRPVRGTGGDDVHHAVGYNFKFTNLQAALGLGQLSYLDRRVARIKQTYRTYARLLEGLDGISLPGFRLEDGESPQWIDAIVDRRDDLDRYLLARNVHCRRFWFPLHTQAAYHQSDECFPNSTRVCRHAIWLPSAFTLSDEDLTTVCGHIADFLTGDTAAGGAS